MMAEIVQKTQKNATNTLSDMCVRITRQKNVTKRSFTVAVLGFIEGTMDLLCTRSTVHLEGNNSGNPMGEVYYLMMVNYTGNQYIQSYQ